MGHFSNVTNVVGEGAGGATGGGASPQWEGGEGEERSDRLSQINGVLNPHFDL
ncbi:hypothetical protein ACFVZD_39570 [Streptomyces sp. NPDC058287]|uniref:hypothetical protein n=1 Tax=unclassified Streptomyces TaxID=2593676 RepID=UPI0036EF2218